MKLWHWAGCAEGDKIGVKVGEVGGYDYSSLYVHIYVNFSRINKNDFKSNIPSEVSPNLLQFWINTHVDILRE